MLSLCACWNRGGQSARLPMISGSITNPARGPVAPTLFPVSVVSIFVTFAAAPALFFRGRRYNGVTMLDAPEPRRRHGIMPVRG